MTDTKRTLLLALIISPLGCSSGSSLNIGNTGGTAGTGTQQLAAYVGSWVGHAEAFSFAPDGSDRVRLTVATDGTGTLQVGEGTQGPATDPNVPYPPDWMNTGLLGSNGLSEGFPYPLHLTRVEAGRLQTGIAESDVFTSWCALQTMPGFTGTTVEPDGTSHPDYSCAPSSWGYYSGPDGGAWDSGTICVINQPDGGFQPINCDKIQLCGNGACSCTATSCTSKPISTDITVPAQFDVNLDGSLDPSPNSMTGTLAFFGSRLTVHLTRQ